MKKYLYRILFFMVFALGVLRCLYIFRFLRDPLRIGSDDPSVFLSPANGIIGDIVVWSGDQTTIQKSYYPTFQSQTEAVGESGYLINIVMNIHNVHYQRAPIESVLIDQQYVAGKFLNAVYQRTPLTAHFENERNEMTFRTTDGMVYKVIQIAGLLARRIIPLVDIGDTVSSAQTIGLIKLGSQVSVLLPASASVRVSVGDRVVDGETVLATLSP